MKRPRWPLIAIAALVGCQQPPAQVDPFLYRSTIPPPATAVPASPALTPGPQPYYTPPPATAVTPVPEAAPAVMPVTPAPPPVQLPPRNFPQRGGFDFPQSSTKQPASGAALPTAVAMTSTAPANSNAAVIRIVEPPAQHVAALPASSPAALPTDNAAKPIADAPAKPAAAAASTTQVALVSATLPLAASPASTTLPTSSASSATPSAAASGSVNYPGDHPGLMYGYDPSYKSLRGKLDYSVTTRLWQLHYLPVGGPNDSYGGSVVIADGRSVNGFEAGDFVAVEGTLSPPTAAGNPATYAISRIKRQ